MKRHLQILAGAICALGFTAAQAVAGDILAMHPFARATAPTAPNGAAFMVLMNQSDHNLAVTSAASNIAERTELHTHLKEDGVMKMRQVDQIDLPAGQEVVLEPGSLHVMFLGLSKPLVQGEAFDVTLMLSDGQTVVVSVPVKGAGAMMTMDHGDMDHGDMGSGSKNRDSMRKHQENHSGSGSKSN